MPVNAFVMDFAARTLRFGFESGDETTLPLPTELAVRTNLDRLTVYPRHHEAVVQLPEGTEAVVELRGGVTVDERLAGRGVAYLDQNKWSVLDRFRRGGSLPANEAAAAEELIAMVDERRVVLPASAGNYVETTPLYGVKRVMLGATVVSLSRGWQMRNPLHVRFDELRLDLEDRDPVAAEVFAPQAPDVFGPPLSRLLPDRRLPPPFDTLGRDLSAALSVAEVLIDPARVPDEGDLARVEAWAVDHARFAKWMGDEGLGPERARRAVLGKLLVDLTPEVIRLSQITGLDPREIVDRYLGADDPIARMPSISRVRGVLYGRLRNDGQRWEGNDLLDIVNLACAAGYANVVIGERQNISYLRQAGTVPPGASLVTTLVEGVEQLRNV